MRPEPVAPIGSLLIIWGSTYPNVFLPYLSSLAAKHPNFEISVVTLGNLNPSNPEFSVANKMRRELARLPSMPNINIGFDSKDAPLGKLTGWLGPDLPAILSDDHHSVVWAGQDEVSMDDLMTALDHHEFNSDTVRLDAQRLTEKAKSLSAAYDQAMAKRNWAVAAKASDNLGTILPPFSQMITVEMKFNALLAEDPSKAHSFAEVFVKENAHDMLLLTSIEGPVEESAKTRPADRQLNLKICEDIYHGVDPDDYQFLTRLADAYFDVGDYRKAVDIQSQALWCLMEDDDQRESRQKTKPEMEQNLSKYEKALKALAHR
jgi:tetratricopeptide (TPR) repeat protein